MWLYCCQVCLLDRAGCVVTAVQADYLTMLNRYLIKRKAPGNQNEEEANTPEILIMCHCAATAAAAAA